MNKISKLALPKTFLSTQPIDLKKDKTDLASEINNRKEDAAGFINNVYKT